MSGSRFLLSGVGTQMMIAVTSRMRLKSLEAEKAPRLYDLSDGFRGNVLDIAFPLVEGIHLRRIDVQSQHGHAGTGELKRQRQTDIT